MPNDYLHNDPNLPLAWSPWFAHEYLTYFCVQALDAVTALPPVAVEANPRYHGKIWPVNPKHIDLYKESYQEHRQLDPLWSFDDKKRNGDFAHDPPSGKKIEPWKVLVIYSTEADLYLDYDLNLHKNQKITGGSHGWRHMHFKMLGTTYGIAPRSFRVHRDLARLALENGNDYWGWRYLARSGHYLADLGHPFHIKGLPLSFLVRKYFTRHELFNIVTAMHQSYEVFVERRFREGFEPFKQALCDGAKEGRATGLTGDAQLRAYIKRAQKKHNPIFYYLLNEFGPELLDAFAQMDHGSQLDAAAQTKRCSAGAARVIFKDANLSKLDYLDKVTAELLFDVGRMLGGLFSGFAKLRK